MTILTEIKNVIRWRTNGATIASLTNQEFAEFFGLSFLPQSDRILPHNSWRELHETVGDFTRSIDKFDPHKNALILGFPFKIGRLDDFLKMVPTEKARLRDLIWQGFYRFLLSQCTEHLHGLDSRDRQLLYINILNVLLKDFNSNILGVERLLFTGKRNEIYGKPWIQNPAYHIVDFMEIIARRISQTDISGLNLKYINSILKFEMTQTMDSILIELYGRTVPVVGEAHYVTYGALFPQLIFVEAFEKGLEDLAFPTQFSILYGEFPHE